MTDARLLVSALRDPATVANLAAEQWTDLIAIARAESLLGSLAHRLAGADAPARVALILAEARTDAAQARRQALWEAEMARRALAPLGVPVILLKGTAYAAADLPAAEGRSIGDLDILVPRDALPEVERALLEAGWEWVKEDAYDDLYYRRWMHELPPLIHRERDRMIDVHHTILPLTARPRPDAAALIEASLSLANGLRILSPPDMIVHAAAHLFADGDLAGGLRNLWDIDRLLRAFGSRPGFWSELRKRAAQHGLDPAVRRAVRLAGKLYETPAPSGWLGTNTSDPPFEKRLLARNGWGQGTHPATRLGFYVRSHWLRMPPLMLARHLLTKARRPA
ncbi:MAG TPA: nucleotidyltransferase family protein [Allosphingosinicella sp.]|jgi:hypothetical protein